MGSLSPKAKPPMREPEVETLLSALGRSDNAMGAMKVLGPHAGKVKQAKEAAPRAEFGSVGSVRSGRARGWGVG